MVPSVLRAHVLYIPAPISVTPAMLACTATVLLILFPMPSSPESLCPQPHTCPSRWRAQLCWMLLDAARTPVSGVPFEYSSTCTGLMLTGLDVLAPSC